MMIIKTEKKPVASLLLVGSLMFLTGCLSEKEKSSKEQVLEQSTQTAQADVAKGELLLSIDGKPVLYAHDFEDQKMMAQQSNQQLNMILQMMPDAEYTMLFKSIEAGHLMKEWVVRSGKDKDPKFIKQMEQYIEAIKLQMYMKLYEDAHPVHVSEHEAYEFYKTKRDQIPGLIAEQASVEIMYVSFDSKSQAENFMSKIKDGSEKHLKLAAKEAGLSLETMMISSDSQCNESLKNSVLAATKFPAKEIVKISDDNYWVVGMLKKKDAEYRSFETPEIKQGITKMCTDEKREGSLTKQIEGLHAQYNVVENVEYFNRKKQNQAHALKKAEQFVMQAQQQATIENIDEDDQDTDFALDDKI